MNAFDYEILDGLCDHVTNTNNHPIPDIIKYLFEEYGELSPGKLHQKEDNVKNFSYDPIFPVSVVFDEIMHLQDLHELTGSTLSEASMMRLAYIILNKTQLFRDSLISWNNKAENQKTWSNFQAHFRKAYRDLKKVRALEIQHSSIANASMLHEIKEHNEQTMQKMTTALTNSLYETVNMMTTEQEQNNLTANAVTIQSLQKEVQDLKLLVQQLTNAKQSQNNAPTQTRKKPRKYCWTHGWCAHAGVDCNAKADGHQDEATLQNRMGGSTKNCPSK